MPRGYGQDVAYVHDTGHDGFARGAAPFVVDRLRRAGLAGGLVVELGCGSGISAAHLLESGYRVLGIDISAAMLALARRRAPRGRFKRGAWRTAPLPRCAAVTALGETLNYRFDAGADEAALWRLFDRAFDALLPGGLFIFDLATPSRRTGTSGGGRRAPLNPSAAGPVRVQRADDRAGVTRYSRHTAQRDWAMLLDVEVDPRRCELTRRITTFRRIGSVYRRSGETHRLRLYRPSEVAARLRATGFRVRILRGYGDLEFPRGLSGFLARKPL